MGVPRFAAVFLTLLVSACSADGGTPASENARGNRSADGAAVPPGPDAAVKIPDGTEGTSILGCTPACQPPRRCSIAASTCLDPGKCLADDDCADGQRCDPSTGMCQVGGDCGEVQFGLERITPNVLVLLDRSG